VRQNARIFAISWRAILSTMWSLRWPPVRVAWLAVFIGACTGGSESAEDADSSSTASTGADPATDASSVTSADGTTSSSTTDGAAESTAGSSTGGIGEDCPPASADIGAVSSFHLGETWRFEGESGVSEGICSAIDYDGARLRLDCVRVDAGADVHTVGIDGGGPIVDEMLSGIVGMEELRLSLPYAMGFFPGFYSFPHFTLRTSDGELLVLGSYNMAGPGDPVVGVDIEGWTAPFAELGLVGHDCEIRPNRPDTFPSGWQPFALEVGTDDGAVELFDGQQSSVLRDGVAYEVSVTMARIPSEVCDKCPPSEAAFSIVRHL
jgi:hypothetical protein